ncbi:hypothetical protein [Ideonella sp.]|uniref:hypothetical protein n=1 Tax=Ideonella sp. TaxID=1929293 RepID=UPI0035AEB7E5
MQVADRFREFSPPSIRIAHDKDAAGYVDVLMGQINGLKAWLPGQDEEQVAVADVRRRQDKTSVRRADGLHTTD